MKNMFGVIGLGRFGINITLTLAHYEQQIMAFDKNQSKLEKVKDYVDSAKILDSTNKDALRESGIHNCSTVIVSIGEAAGASFLTVLNLKEMGVENIIAKANTLEQGKILEKIGATRVIYPERESAIRLASQLTSSDILEYLEVSTEYQVSEVVAPEEFVGKSLKELHLRENFNVIVLAIRRKGKVIGIPTSTEVIKEEDLIVFVGQAKVVRKLVSKYKLVNKYSLDKAHFEQID
ncbi:TrkA family potassium uptake protein [Candidatus Woesearchaeota archaeon]|nr:TrkA family potassium uptake protein [Candidatus Woesearchaeota archaeon]MBS3124062.1 TrkA family potassium uptake protein [Candidatus Woesearchaeota archaeon]